VIGMVLFSGVCLSSARRSSSEAATQRDQEVSVGLSPDPPLRAGRAKTPRKPLDLSVLRPGCSIYIAEGRLSQPAKLDYSGACFTLAEQSICSIAIPLMAHAVSSFLVQNDRSAGQERHAGGLAKTASVKDAAASDEVA
jgi:hypothetical protein